MKDIIRLLGYMMLAAMLVSTGCDKEKNDNSALMLLLLDGGDIDVSFLSATQTGGNSGTADSEGLTLTFDVDPTTLTANEITVTGATKGMLTGSGTTRSLAISNITVDNGETVSVMITNPAGYSINGSSKTAVVYKQLAIGVPHQGGVIAYIFLSGDPDYVVGQTHGLIAATSDQSTGIIWAVAMYQSMTVPEGTGTALGTGSVNTDRIITQNGAGINYAAGLARAYNGGGYTDWYLPSLDELIILYHNRVAIGGFANALYWSSSEYDTSKAWNQLFSGGNECNMNKFNGNRVRAIRTF